MYLGVNYGVIMDMLDLEAVEVLRGPQGLLFGRNVTGGAVLLRSRRPGGETSADAALRVETGLDRRVTGSVEGSLADGAVAARLGQPPQGRRLVRQRSAWWWRGRQGDDVGGASGGCLAAFLPRTWTSP